MEMDLRRTTRDLSVLASAAPGLIAGLYLPKVHASHGLPSFFLSAAIAFAVPALVITLACMLFDEPKRPYLIRAAVGFFSAITVGFGLTFLFTRPYVAVMIVNAPIPPIAALVWYSRKQT